MTKAVKKKLELHPELPARYAAFPRVAPPNPAQVRRAREKAGLTQLQAAVLIYVDVDTWRQYEKPKEQGNARTMRAGLWELFLLKAGETPPNLYNPPVLAFERADVAPVKKAALFKRAAQ